MVYNSFILLSAKRNYNTYKYKLAAIVKYGKKYFHIFNTKYWSIIYIDHELLIKFLNMDYNENIFVHLANKLRSFNIYIQYILEKKNTIAESLF